ncbi:MAG: gamma carbonic anhydrase family protein [Alphaproteobacteria bacterium]|nr:MAG: gamma carbonic anhydrase family protein [Alphaproteobacteria bacterium]
MTTLPAAFLPYKGKVPQVSPTAWMAPNCTVIGDTHIGARSSIWFGAVLRGDVHHIRIGDFTNVQDNAVIHVTTGKLPTLIGNRVTIGHSAVVHACTLEDECLVGMGSVVLDGALVQTRSMVAAGAVVSPGKVVETGWLWAGVPARPMRKLTEDELQYLAWSATHYANLADNYR